MKNFYEHMNSFIFKHPFFKGCIYFVSRFCPYMIIIFYSLFLLKIYIEWESQLLYFIKNPLLSLAIVIILKLIFNRKRPCQKYKIKTVDDLQRQNYSFPSIQTACAFSIALTVLKYGPNMGLLLAALAIGITVSRVLSGVHYISDVLVSIIIAFIINSL